MEHKKILNVLVVILVLSCLIVTGVIFKLRSEIFYLPGKAAEKLTAPQVSPDHFPGRVGQQQQFPRRLLAGGKPAAFHSFHQNSTPITTSFSNGSKPSFR